MNSNPMSESTNESSTRLTGLIRTPGLWIGVAVVLVVLGLVARGNRSEEVSVESVFEVQRGPLTISVIQPGTVQSREQAKVLCEVPGNRSILWVIEEGSEVDQGEVLIRLDASELEENLLNQQIVVENAEAGAIRAEENFQVMKLDEAGEVAKAELALRLAEMDLKAYEKEEYPQKLQKAETDITIAEEEILRASDKVEWSTRLAEEGYLTRSELQGDQLAEKRAKISLTLAESELRTIQEFSHVRSLEKLKAEVLEAERGLDRVHHKHKALFAQAEADIRAKNSELERQRKKLESIQEWIISCTITSPVPGMVVYSTTGADRHFRRSNEAIAEGVQVRERQHLISLPTAASMMVKVRVYESSIEKIALGMPARITVDSLAGQQFQGSVAKIGILPEAEMSWMSSDLKSYTVNVNVEGEAEGLRPGMSCNVEIVVDEFEDALYIPLQSVVHLGNRPVVYSPHRGGPEAREVELGLDNQSMVHILSGLKEGERVLMAPPIPVGYHGGGGGEEKPAIAPEPSGGQAPAASQKGQGQPASVDRSNRPSGGGGARPAGNSGERGQRGGRPGGERSESGDQARET